LTEHGRTLIKEIISTEMKLMGKVGANLSNEDISTALEVVLTVADRLKTQAGESE
jgi:DNA-binding MarR family transcriptional regulator